MSDHLSVVIAGHVDHGKSTVVGRLLADAGGLPEGKLEQVRAYCERNSKPFEYAFLLDALKDEQAQGITIDSARVFFRTPDRSYILIDAPGHVEFLKNMVSGAARADAALVVIDAHEGIRENSRRHGYILSFLGLTQLSVLVNKMDLVGYAAETFRNIEKEYSEFLASVGLTARAFIPVAGMAGANLATRSAETPWYAGPTVLEALAAFRPAVPPHRPHFRMPVQDVYKFTAGGDTRRIVAGTVESGTLAVGDALVFYPAGKRSRVKSIESFGDAPDPSAGSAVGFTLTDELYVTRGDVAARAGEPPPAVASRLRARVIWLGARPLACGPEYGLRLGTARVGMRVEQVERAIDASAPGEPAAKDRLDRHEVGDCVLALTRPLALDCGPDALALGRFVIIEDHAIRGGGVVTGVIEDASTAVREKVLRRNLKWEPSAVSRRERSEKYRQRATLVVVTGPRDSRRKEVARALESRLFADGRIVYFLGIGNVKYGVDADLLGQADAGHEHVRRLAEVANILLDLGVILIVTAMELTSGDLDLVRATVDADAVVSVWLGEEAACGFRCDLALPDAVDADAAEHVRRLLLDRGAIGTP